MAKKIIVIGSGFGGLAASLRLKAKGYKVTLIEKHPDLGGRARVFKKGDFIYDGGPTVITAPYLFEELFSLFNKKGEWLAKINNIRSGKVEFSIQEKLRNKENLVDIWLAFSPIKSNYSNFMIQKATELGITKFIPIIFDRTIVRKINSERLEKIIIEATEQSNRINPPLLEKPQNLKSFLNKNEDKIIQLKFFIKKVSLYVCRFFLKGFPKNLHEISSIWFFIF